MLGVQQGAFRPLWQDDAEFFDVVFPASAICPMSMGLPVKSRYTVSGHLQTRCSGWLAT
jgi:hypothetical protein